MEVNLNQSLYSQKMKSMVQVIESTDVHRYLFAATSKAIKVLAVHSGQCLRSFGFAGQKHRVMDFAVDPMNEFRIIVAYNDSTLKVFDWTDGLLITVISQLSSMLTIS
jgi:hypothetical protein